MTKITSLQAIAAALLACGLSAAPAQAGPNRTWVSGTGTDGGTCTRAAPCKTFAFALTQTAAGGEIDVLDPAGYGAVTINHAISIINDGVGVAAVGVSSGNAITINAGATDSVHLRGLTLTGLGTGLNGIQFTTGENLAIENCVIRNFANAGLNITPSTSSSFSVSNTISSNNSAIGISVQPTGSAVVSGVLSNVTANSNISGILVAGSGVALNVTIANSNASNNSSLGVAASTAATALLLSNVVASNNNTGIAASTSSTVRVGQSVVTGNVTGVFTTGGGVLDSYGDNDINGNTTDNTSVLTPITKN
jgi:Periplasmic copper-binding protein (NosD)